MKNLVSIAALAFATLCVPGIAMAQDVPATASAPTASDADAFVARAEKDLFNFSVEGGRVAWINSTYLTDDTDAIAARYGEIGTEKAVAYALEAAKYQALAGTREMSGKPMLEYFAPLMTWLKTQNKGVKKGW